MGLFIADLVKETSTTTGTGALTLAGAVDATFRSALAAGATAGDTAPYAIQDLGNGGYETGMLTFGAGAATFTRTVDVSSNGNAPVNWPAGTRIVSIGLTASMFLTRIAAALNNTAVTGFKTATFNGVPTNALTSGAITIDWSAGNIQKQVEPTGSITYTFAPPPGPCHLELRIDSDGTSSPQTITWPASVKWIGGAAWVGVANKIGVINFSYDGTTYLAQGVNQV